MFHWLARQRYLMDYTLAAMWRRKWRNLVLLVVFTLVVFLLASVSFFGSAVRFEAKRALKFAPEVMVQNLVLGRHALAPADWVDKLKGIRGTRNVRGRLWGYFYDQGNGANYTVMVADGSDPSLAVAPGEVIVGAGVARVREVEKLRNLLLLRPDGKLFKLRAKRILSDDSALLTHDLVLLSEADFREFFNLPRDAGFTDIALEVRNRREVATIANKISQRLPNARVVTREDILRTYENVFSWREGVLQAMLAASLAAFAIFAFDKASGLSAEERREIGILKALGWDTSDILAMKLWEGALLALFAFLIGAVAAYAHVFLFQAGVLAPVLKGWAVLYPQAPLTPQIDRLQLVTLAMLTIVPFIAATLVPVWKAAITDPEVVMR